MTRVPPLPSTGQELSAPRRRVLEAVARLEVERDVVTLADVAERVGGHPNSSRQHLESLQQLGLVASGKVEKSSTGRPPLSYATTQAGRRVLSAVHDDARNELLTAIITHAATMPDGPERARLVGEFWGRERAARLAESSEDVMDVLCQSLDEMGFDATRETTDEGDRLVLSTCPLHELAREHPQIVCTLHEGMLQTIATELGSRNALKLVPGAAPGCCWVDRKTLG